MSVFYLPGPLAGAGCKFVLTPGDFPTTMCQEN